MRSVSNKKKTEKKEVSIISKKAKTERDYETMLMEMLEKELLQ